MRIKISNFFYLILGLIGFKATPAMAADQIFLCSEPLQGEATEPGYEGCIDVLSWSWGAFVAITPPSGGGREAGEANFQDLTVIKTVDKSTPAIMTHTTMGEVIPKLEIEQTACAAECSGMGYYKLSMEEVLISSVALGGAAGNGKPTEHVSFNFTKIEWCYTPQDPKGGLGDPLCGSWDLATGKPY